MKSHLANGVWELKTDSAQDVQSVRKQLRCASGFPDTVLSTTENMMNGIKSLLSGNVESCAQKHGCNDAFM